MLQFPLGHTKRYKILLFITKQIDFFVAYRHAVTRILPLKSVYLNPVRLQKIGGTLHMDLDLGNVHSLGETKLEWHM